MERLHLSEQEIIRRDALSELINLGIDPFPAETFDVNVSTAEIIGSFKPGSGLTRMSSLPGG